MYYKRNRFENAVLFHENNTVVEQILTEIEIVSTIKKPINSPHPEGITLTIEDAQRLGIPENT